MEKSQRRYQKNAIKIAEEERKNANKLIKGLKRYMETQNKGSPPTNNRIQKESQRVILVPQKFPK